MWISSTTQTQFFYEAILITVNIIIIHSGRICGNATQDKVYKHICSTTRKGIPMIRRVYNNYNKMLCFIL